MTNNRNEEGDITIVPTVTKIYYKQLHAKNLENLGEVDKFLENHNLPKL